MVPKVVSPTAGIIDETLVQLVAALAIGLLYSIKV
jgi:hypothetical protein